MQPGAGTPLLHAALSRMKGHVTYGEARLVSEKSERIRVRDRRPEQVGRSQSQGIGIRVLVGGAWGFSCTEDLREEAVLLAVDRAVELARATSRVTRNKITLHPQEPTRGRYETSISIDPFVIPLEEKLGVLLAPVDALLAGGKPFHSAEGEMQWTRMEKHLVTTDGTDVAQAFTYGRCGIQITVLGADGMTQRRSYPTWGGCDGFQAGYERIAALDLMGNVERLREEARALLTAPICPAGTRDIILESSQVGLQIHESCGHPTELDRALGTEISLAGGSFLQPGLLDTFRYGSNLVNLVADSTSPGGMGTFGWDDEGTAAGTFPLVREGMFVDYLSSRDTAGAIQRAPTATMRADGWNRAPLIRMVNVSLQPGQGSLEDLIADTKDGILIATDRSWSIDDLRLNFQFSCEIAWEIKNGKRTRILRDPFYTGITPSFWGSCDAICGPEEWRLWGINTCGKGDPMQAMQVGHGASPARFRQVTVGNAGGHE